MEDISTGIPPAAGETTGLQWSEALRSNIRRCARAGNLAITGILVLCALLALTTAYQWYVWLADYPEDFYLLEGDNPKRTWGFATALAAVVLCIRASWQGRNAMRYLAWGADDYEDSETLAAGFYDLRDSARWYGYWALFLFCVYVLETIVF